MYKVTTATEAIFGGAQAKKDEDSQSAGRTATRKQRGIGAWGGFGDFLHRRNQTNCVRVCNMAAASRSKIKEAMTNFI